MHKDVRASMSILTSKHEYAQVSLNMQENARVSTRIDN